MPITNELVKETLDKLRGLPGKSIRNVRDIKKLLTNEGIFLSHDELESLRRLLIWRELFRRFDPMQPPERPEWRQKRSSIIVLDEIASGLDGLEREEKNGKKCILLGSIGCGKSTELRTIAAQYGGEYYVVFFDLDYEIKRLTNDGRVAESLAPWQLVGIITLACSAALAAENKRRWDWNSDVLKQLATSWESLSGLKAGTLDLAAIASKMRVLTSAPGKGELEPIGGTAEASDRDWVGIVGGARQDQENDPEIRTFIRQVHAIHKQIAEITKLPTLVIMDGLDQVFAKPEQSKLIHHLLVRSRFNSDLPCSAILTVPVSMAKRRNEFADYYQVAWLPNEPVLTWKAPSCPDVVDAVDDGPRGLEFFENLFHARVEDLVDEPLSLISRTDLRWLGWKSAGRLRDFVACIRTAASRAYSRELTEKRPTSKLQRDVLEDVISLRQARMEAGLVSKQIQTLVEIRDAKRLPAWDGTVIDLLAFNRVVPYRTKTNSHAEHEWFFPHTLLLDYLTDTGR